LKIYSAGGHLRTENLNQSGFLSSQDPTLIDAVQANGLDQGWIRSGQHPAGEHGLADALSDLTLRSRFRAAERR